MPGPRMKDAWSWLGAALILLILTILLYLAGCTYQIMEIRTYNLDVYADDNSTIAITIPVSPNVTHTQSWPSSVAMDATVPLTGLP